MTLRLRLKHLLQNVIEVFVMANPCDRPLVPPRGDDHEDITYAAVGRLISSWEGIEVELSHLYAIFTGQYLKREAYDRYYDNSKNFAGRMRTLEESAQQFFIGASHQNNETDLSELVKKIRGFSVRRHEVAHGIVRPYYHYAPLTGWSDPLDTDRTRTCVAPPHYQRNWFSEHQIPLYVYASPEINSITEKLDHILVELVDFKTRFLKQAIWQTSS
jgi:hypothetical protein